MERSTQVEYCHEIVERVSRTFAIGIERLSEPLSTYICVSYLLCRIPDTLEDAPELSPSEKLDLLGRYREALESGDPEGQATRGFLRAVSPRPSGSSSWELVAHTDRVLHGLGQFSVPIQDSIRTWVHEMVDGMHGVIRDHGNTVRLSDMEEFSEYCYYVAGTVGRMLTELFRQTHEFRSRPRERMEALAPQFGEALQTVNILKDVHDDYVDEDTVYIPERLLAHHGSSPDRLLECTEGTLRAAGDLMDHAHEKLDRALEYIRAVPYRAEEVRDFCIVPYLLAQSTLREIEERTPDILEPSAVKIDRQEVYALLTHVPDCIASNEYLVDLSQQARRSPILPSG